MKHSLALLALLALPVPVMAQSPDAALEHARKLLETTPLIDGHNDLPWEIRTNREHPHDVAAYDLRKTTPGHTDLARLAEGRVGGQFWSVYIPGEIKDSGYARVQLEQIDIARRVIAAYPDKLAPAYSADDIEREFKDGKIASLMGMEGGHAIENSLGALRAYYALGVRYMTLTHNVTLDWADAALDSAKHGGLTPFGKEVVREMNRLGMLVDLAHVSPGTMSDALDATRAPVIFSHSGARAIVDHPRNVPDSILARLKQNGGVVMVPVVPEFVSRAVKAWQDEADAALSGMRTAPDSVRRQARREWMAAHPRPHATVKDVADVIEHIRDVAGVDHVGIGADYDGITSTPDGLPDVSSYPVIFAELIRRGWSDADLKKLAGQNVLRVFHQAEAVAKKLQQTEKPSVKTIQELDGAPAT
ncbi:MAG TPA: dipeptidase [Gemmatimonadales bacterium]|nr:dipeptidase [Gemmatimonadales bacterium]